MKKTIKYDMHHEGMVYSFTVELYKDTQQTVDVLIDGVCNLPYFVDTTDFSQQEELSSDISEVEFNMKISDSSMLPNGDYEFSKTENGNLLMPYNIDQDIHYFFGKK